MYIYVGMYVRTYVCMYVCMDVCMYVRMCVCICMCVCMYILQGPMFVKPVSCQKKTVLFWNCLIVLLLRLPAQQCTQPQSSTYGGHECEEDVRCHGGVPESTNVWVCLLL